MAQPIHVPKFGDWDSDNIPYTSFFENTLKDKTPGSKNFNPNDPEQNPDALVSGIFPAKFELKNNKFDEFHQEYKEVQANNKSYPKAKNPENSKSGSGSEKSISDYSLPLPPQRRGSRNSDDDSARSTQTSQQGLLKPGRSPRLDAIHDMPSSVPRFGIWDEIDTKSGDGFTVIFNKVKQEKQVAASRLPKIPADETIYPSNQKNHAKSSSLIPCCIRPSVDE